MSEYMCVCLYLLQNNRSTGICLPFYLTSSKWSFNSSFKKYVKHNCYDNLIENSNIWKIYKKKKKRFSNKFHPSFICLLHKYNSIFKNTLKSKLSIYHTKNMYSLTTLTTVKNQFNIVSLVLTFIPTRKSHHCMQ